MKVKYSKNQGENFLRMLNSGDNKRAILVCGPKGCGKTASLLMLKYATSLTSLYVDLDSHTVAKMKSLDEVDIEVDRDILFLDNAQNYIENLPLPMSLRETKYVVAAFSPGIRAADSHRPFQKTCGDGQAFIYHFRPLSKTESEAYIKFVCNTSVTDETHNNREIDRDEFQEIFFFSRGAYLTDILNGRHEESSLEIAEQHNKAFRNVEDPDRIALLIISHVSDSASVAPEASCLIDLGLAYYGKEMSLHLANFAHLRFAIAHLKLSTLPLNDLHWMKLETYSYLCISPMF